MLRDDLERLVPDLTDELWSYLVELGFVGEVESGALEVDALAEQARQVQRAGRAQKPREAADALAEPEALQRASTRAEALSVLLAGLAAEDDDVKAFRRKALRDGLIKPEGVGSWIEKRAKPPTRLVTVRESRRGEPLASSVRTLAYAAAGSKAVQHVPVAVGSELDRLRGVSESLAQRYAWQPAQASNFVLTGLVPMLAPVRARVQHRLPVTAATRIVLDVDPTTTPREVAESYLAVRRSLLAGRSRRMSEKHLRLAIHASDDTDGTWHERMIRWNERNPSERYSEPSNFQRDAKQAIRRLLEPPLRA